MAVRTLTRRESILALAGLPLSAQEPAPPEWVCPMDPDIRSKGPERCKKCGMALVAGLPVPEEFPVDMVATPRAPRPKSPFTLRFRISKPKAKVHPKLQLIHEKQFHLFLVSQDLSVFRHEHPEAQSDGSFLHRTVLPAGGMYRVLCDFYPENATPQMVAKTVFLSGSPSSTKLAVDGTPKTAENLRVSLRTEPAKPLAGKKTMLFFELEPADQLERYLGAWGHLLVASSDLIDMIHTHPAWEDSGSPVQFNVILPRPGLHRVWAQFQRGGVVNTVDFTLEVGSI